MQVKAELYSGLEVGSKGVKLSIIDVNFNSKGINYTQIFDSTINTDFINFNFESHQSTLLGMKKLYLVALLDYNVFNSNIFVAVSSGVRQSSIKLNRFQSIDSLIDNFKKDINENEKNIEVLTSERESVLSHKGIIPSNEKMTSILIDIGSGNTKGGYYITENLFNTFVLPWGTKSTLNSINKSCITECAILDFLIKTENKLDEIEAKDLKKVTSKYGIDQYNFNVLFSGGVVWSVANLVYPKKVTEKRIELTYDELYNLYYMCYMSYDHLIKDIDDNENFNSEKKKILSVFSQRDIIAGTGLMLRIMKQFETNTLQKKFILIKKSKVSWITAYILEQIESKQLSISK